MAVSLVKTLHYRQVVRMGFGWNNDDYDQAVHHADVVVRRAIGRDRYPGLYRGTLEWVDALVDYLGQWDYGDNGECKQGKPATPGYGWEQVEHNGYLLEWSEPWASVALYRIERGCECEADEWV